MFRFLRLSWFHLKLYTRDQYFFWLTIFSTASLFLLQYVSAYAGHQLGDRSLWVRAAVFGVWASATTAAGSLGFQSFQGVMPFLTNSRTDSRLSLAAVQVPAASYGLLAFPLAWLLAALVGAAHNNVGWRLVGMALCLWLTAIVMDFFISAFFFMSRHAIAYEGLVTLPILYLSGLFGALPLMGGLLKVTVWLIPVAAPVHALLNGEAFNWPAMLLSSALWLVVTWFLSTELVNRMRARGQE